jgi:hypothetical protein
VLCQTAERACYVWPWCSLLLLSMACVCGPLTTGLVVWAARTRQVSTHSNPGASAGLGFGLGMHSSSSDSFMMESPHVFDQILLDPSQQVGRAAKSGSLYRENRVRGRVLGPTMWEDQGHPHLEPEWGPRQETLTPRDRLPLCPPLNALQAVGGMAALDLGPSAMSRPLGLGMGAGGLASKPVAINQVRTLDVRVIRVNRSSTRWMGGGDGDDF